MFPAPFEYRIPTTVQEALESLARQQGEAKVLAGGHSLLPMMKLRLSTPAVILDLVRLRNELAYIREDGGMIRIGTLTTHQEIEHSPLLKARCPLLAETAALIADIQVRNRGTIGGSLAHADPAADYPAPVLAMGAALKVKGLKGERTIPADRFFVDAFTTALQEGELLTELSAPAFKIGVGSSYQKFANKASHFAVVGVAAVVEMNGNDCRQVRVGITGAGPKAVRAIAVEDALRGRSMTPEVIAAASDRAAEGIECLSDIHGSGEYRTHLCRVLAKRALSTAAERAKRS